MKLTSLLNYLGQLRMYSFLDLLVLTTALTREPKNIWGIAFFWLSFLLYLESQHQDKPRLEIKKYLWMGPFAVSLFLLPLWLCLGFALFSYCYTKKKKEAFWGTTAPLWRGLQNGIIAAAFNFPLAVIVFGLIFIRNLTADFRDAGSDAPRGIKTIPVLWGIKKDQLWAFYGHLLLVIATTLVWFHYSFLDKIFILPIILLQILSYPLTPRLSNPNYLNLYKNKS